MVDKTGADSVTNDPITNDSIANDSITNDSIANESITNDSVVTANDEAMIIGDNNNRRIFRNKNDVLVPGRREGVPGRCEAVPGHGEGVPGRGEGVTGHGEGVPGRDGAVRGHGEAVPGRSEPVLIERGVHGTVITVNRLKHYAFLKRNDENQYTDIFAREASIIHPFRQGKLFLSDKCKFDVIRTSRGFEAVNIQITERHIRSVSQLPKIPKKKENMPKQTAIPVDVFQSTITGLFREVLRKHK